MTTEEVIKIAKGLRTDFKCESDTMVDFCNTIIKALEQQPYEDVVSRQAVNDLVDELARAISDERCCISRGRSTATIMRDILHLPSVTPKEKTGKWVGDKCSNCENERAWYGNNPLFCPDCGARMVSE